MKHLKLYENFDIMCHFIVLVGAPCSGKSTYIKNVLSKELNDDYIVIERDAIVDDVAIENNLTYDDMFIAPNENEKEGDVHPKFGKVVSSGEGNIWNKLSYEKLNKLNNKVYWIFKTKMENSVKSNKNIIVDMTNMNPKSRKGILKFIKNEKDFYKIAIVFNNGGKDIEDILTKVAEKRRKEIELSGGKKTIGKEVYKRMLDSYIEPTKDEGFDEIRHVNTRENLMNALGE